MIVFTFDTSNNLALFSKQLRKDTNIMKLNKGIASLRKSFNLTQVECAKRAGVGLRFLKELEHGKKTVRLDKVNCVLQLFGKEVGIIDEL
jgi:predicted transcriptional regulator